MEIVEQVRLDELKTFLEKGKVPICLINYDLFIGRENHFAGHYLVLTNVTDDIVTYHETGPKNAGPNKVCSTKRFLDAWNLCFFDHNLVLVG